MIYRSNLTCPDLTSHFKHLVSRPMPHSMGHDVPSDWGDKADDDPVFGLYKRCGLWTFDECAILGAVVSATGMQAGWVDIGCHTGWTSKHINWSSNAPVVCVDPMLNHHLFAARFGENTGFPWSWRFGGTSNEYFEHLRRGDPDKCIFKGFVIDGDHGEGKPLEDAMNAARHLADTGVIMLHDGVGRPVQEAVRWLMSQGFKARAYFSPHLVFCCWRGDFVPPDHEPDPEVKRMLLDGRFRDFDFERMS